MDEPTLLGPWLRRFLLEHLVGDRNLARNTQRSYRDTMVLLVNFLASDKKKPVDRLVVEDVSADAVRSFLLHLEETRKCGITTRNQRLAAIHALARFVAANSPEHIAWCGEIRSLPFKKTSAPEVTYLEKPEMDALLAAPDRTCPQGRRDYALLLFLYNSGARADEAACLTVGDLETLGHQSSVRILGKGGKVRRCPLWAKTVDGLGPIVGQRAPTDRLFLNRRGQMMTRFGVHAMVKRYGERAAAGMPSLKTKRISPHTIRHTTATHLLLAGVDINTIRAWLGHVSLDTTNIYAEINLETKAKALEKCTPDLPDTPKRRWRNDPKLMAFLRAI
jgi:site-specific recombinase XerD